MQKFAQELEAASMIPGGDLKATVEDTGQGAMHGAVPQDHLFALMQPVSDLENYVPKTIRGNIGHGCDVKFWVDPWVLEVGPLIDYVSPNLSIDVATTVADMATLDGRWRWIDFEHILPRFVLLRIATICRPKPHLPPDWIS
ncbi:hypothetical protein V6N13_025447 [Hibiscus sabdariffa]